MVDLFKTGELFFTRKIVGLNKTRLTKWSFIDVHIGPETPILYLGFVCEKVQVKASYEEINLTYLNFLVGKRILWSPGLFISQVQEWFNFNFKTTIRGQ